MKKMISLFTLCLFANMLANAQKLPPVYFSKGTNICDPPPYKLVFQDDFNGSTIDATKWRTFNAWGGMEPYENDHWGQGRVDASGLVHLKDENVVVGGGVCKLLLKKEKENVFVYDSHNLSDPSGHNVTTRYSKGYLCTWNRSWNATHTRWDKLIGYNSGRFESRLQMPICNESHSTFWLWHTNGINELDIAECYGGPIRLIGSRRRIGTSLHVWAPSPNPYGLKPDYEDGATQFPNQRWGNVVAGNYFRQQHWHTYACEWDTNIVRFFVDGNLHKEIHKYYTDVTYKKPFITWPVTIWRYYKVHYAIDCIVPENAVYNIYQGFVYNNDSKCEVRLDVGIEDKKDYPWYPGMPAETLGEMTIDYVKIWQRHPEADNHVDLCNQNVPKIIGPSIIPSTGGTTFSVDYPVSGASWLSTAGFGLGGTPANISSPTTASCIVSKKSTYSKKFFTLLYSYTKEGCPTQTITKRIDIGEPVKPPVFVVNVNYGNSLKYLQIGATPSVVNTPTTYEWTINYGDQKTYHAFGQHISTPVFSNTESDFVNWTLTVSNAVGSSTFTGSKTNNIYLSALNDTATEDDDTASYYFNALIDDTAFYEREIDTMISQQFVTDTIDTIAIWSMIEKTRFDALEPYLIYDTSTNGNSSANYRIAQTLTPVESVTKIYPNPSNNILNIDLGTNYVLEEPKHLVVTNSIGAVVLKKELSNTTFKNTIELNQLASGVYILEISQKGYSQKTKFTKQ